MPVSVVVRGGVVHDGTGAPGRRADVAIEGDRVVAVGDVDGDVDARVVDATGLAVCPGFINVLSHAWGSLQLDGSGASDTLQGVTTEVFGEAFSLGPTDEQILALLGPDEEGIQVVFDRLSTGLDTVARMGIVPNIASFVGGTNLRILAAGFDDRRLTEAELGTLRGIVREEMQEGALGIGTALIYPPGRFADTDELVSLCEVVGEYDGVYISHLRSEGDQFLECLDELLAIGQRAQCRTEVYHLKAAGRHNHHKMAPAIERIAAARDAGQRVTADMYPYAAGGTALGASIPPPYHVGGPAALAARLDSATERRRMAADMRRRSDDFENLFLAADEGAGILLLSDLADGTPTGGRRLSEVVADLGTTDPADALLEAVRRDPHVQSVYFMIGEENIRLGLGQPWVSIGSDAAAHPAAAPWIERATHPRTYGTFARFLGHYARDLGLVTFDEAIRRITSLPADTLGLAGRGRLTSGAFADLVVLDPATVIDTATYEQPHSHALGVRHVLVNGVPVVTDGAVTDARPGRRLRRAR
ncbi:MAG TPA: amidohydrolase family protein [Mycobacteriales bacterium]|nr:amidohydrolase family protein [Mycobacteriales bacterium]